jgi:signal transduction histidine kinase
VLVLGWTSWLVVPWSLGALVQVRSTAAERARHDLVARAALEERMRVTQEVHDVAGHGLAAIAMQAGVALVGAGGATRPGPPLPGGDPGDQHPGADPVTGHARRHPPAQGEQARRLVGCRGRPGRRRGRPGRPARPGRRVRAGGLPVDLQVERAEVTLPPEVDAAAYRVVQEALTNVLRHAGPTRALVRVTRQDDEVVIQVADRGRGTAEASPVGGRGLRGMRARVESVGGSLTAGPRDGGGFQVVARLPLAGGAG